MHETAKGYGGFKTSDDDVVLSWNSLPFEKCIEAEIEDKLLTGVDVHGWLVNELIPKVICQIENDNIRYNWIDKLFNIDKNISIDCFLKKYQSSNYIVFDYKDNMRNKNVIGNKSYLVNIIEILQCFYSNIDSIYFDIEKLTGLYEGIVLLLEVCEKYDLSYLYGNLNDLNISEELLLSNFIAAINDKILNIQSGTTNEMRLDFIFRCYTNLIRNNIDLFSDKFINTIEQKLKASIQLMDFLELRNRRLNRLSY